MKNKELVDYESSLAKEETSLFNHRRNWNALDSIDEKYLQLIFPYDIQYHNPLRAIFSFQIKRLETLNAFSHILFQDGLYFLLNFFFHHPNPGKLRTNLIVHKNLLPLVPEAWRERVFSYQIELSRLAPPMRPEADTLYLTGRVHPLHLNAKDLESELLPVIQLLKNKPQLKVKMMLAFLHPRGEDYIDFEQGESFEFGRVIERLIGNFDIQFISWNQLQRSQVAGQYFLDINPRQFLYSDGYLSHLFLSQGGLPVTPNPEGQGQFVQLSPYHGMCVSPYQSNSLASSIEMRIREAKQSFLKNELAVNRDLQDYYKINLSSSAFERFSHQIASEIFRK
jgi:hypothetical protein